MLAFRAQVGQVGFGVGMFVHRCLEVGFGVWGVVKVYRSKSFKP